MRKYKMLKELSDAPIAPIVSIEEGVIDQTPQWARKHWVFTINNYSHDDKNSLCSIAKGGNIVVAQTEVGDETATKHIQGIVTFTNKDRLRRHFKPESRIFFPKSICKKWTADRLQKARMYASKPNRGESVSLHRYNHFDDWKLIYGWNRPVALIPKLYCWEKQLIKLIEKKPDNRTIYWIFGKYGCGKTVMAKHLYQEYGFLPLEGGKRHILSIAAANPRTKGFTFLLGKANGNHISYEALEKVKDQIFMSHFGCDGTKPYCSNQNVHCVVFANVPPNLSTYHADKTIVYMIKKRRMVRWKPNMEELLRELGGLRTFVWGQNKFGGYFPKWLVKNDGGD